MDDQPYWPSYGEVQAVLAKWASDQPAIRRVVSFGGPLRVDGSLDLVFEVDERALKTAYGADAAWQSAERDWHEQLQCALPYALTLRKSNGGFDPITKKGLGDGQPYYVMQSLVRRENMTSGVMFIAFAALDAWVLMNGEVPAGTWKYWLFLLGGIGFFCAGALALVASVRNWSLSKSNRTFETALAWAVGTPFLLVGIAIAAWLLFYVAGWLHSIPAWAAVIIVLLVILLLKKK
ncbi:hypothetical protein LK996_01215 [Lysobacter sp. A6]|uniref:DUF2812 domain-containing protein n=1 Tax=Noviluteimonas lactosilytica TaxID=2888523 RepID=A0ABS8JDR5_9GAMM|nr:hypothetical protein [Lysobacter lactosilyticus]MCC8361704.1 hypothetical protein [Lysobacter lactosilyticus]